MDFWIQSIVLICRVYGFIGKVYYFRVRVAGFDIVFYLILQFEIIYLVNKKFFLYYLC